MRVIALAALAAVVLSGCYSGDPKPGPTDAKSLEFRITQTVVIDDNGIHPEVVRARVGEAISVENHGTRDHGLTSEAVETGTLRPGESTTVFFTTTGTIEAHDRTDPSHTAKIEVSPGG